MLITHTPISLPVSTANHAVESLANESINKPQIPASTPTEQSSHSKNSTEFAEHQKAASNDIFGKNKEVEEKSKNDSGSDSDNEQSDQQAGNTRDESVQSDLSELSLAEQKIVTQLQARDREVKTHEQAHASVGGSLAGSPNLSYTTGPDGKRYATSGDVSIDISKVANDLAATIRKLEQVQRAALAPANPSAQDQKVAAAASAGANEARAELTIENIEKSQELRADSKESSGNEGQIEEKDSQSNNVLNPIRAKRESIALNEKIQNSGAFDKELTKNLLSLTA